LQKQLSREAAIHLLETEHVGHLATCNSDHSPYITPLNYVYFQNNIYFHCAPQGRKLDYLRANPQVCFAVNRVDKIVFQPTACNCATRYHSVLAFGKARVVPDAQQKALVLNALTAKYAAGRNFEPVTAEAAAACCVVEISIDRLEGKCNVDPEEDGISTICQFTTQ
jgi:nitroimidazol reductase NimA-like FMN-containing flavoprotein (pyridoxamine 5'-phosphate oxidase superfamily)